MFRMLIIIAAVALARDAYADAKTQKMVTGYQREARSCKIQNDGVTKLREGATAMQAEVNDDEVAADLATLRTAHESIQAFCAELAVMIELLNADRNAPYKSLEPQIMEHDKKLRELRKAFKQATDGVTPIIRRLVPRINKFSTKAAHAAAKGPAPAAAPEATPAATTKPQPEPAKPAATAPPRPAPPPPAPVKITEGPSTSLAMRAFTGGTCDDQAKQSAMKAEAFEREAPKKRAAGTLAWLPGARWRTSYVSGDRLIQSECVATKSGGVILTLEGPNPPRADREVLDVAARAIAATAKQ
jgi:hypothetical protein